MPTVPRWAPVALAMSLVLASAAACGGHHRPTWQAMRLPETAAHAAMIDAQVAGDGTVVAVGALVEGASGPQPLAWRLPASSQSWRPTVVAPSEPDGTHARLLSIAFRGQQAVALGVATGGLHGNPRPVLWAGDDSAIHETFLLRELFGGPRIIEVRGVAAGDLGWFTVGTWSARGPERQVAQVWRAGEPPDWERLADEPSRLSPVGEQLWGLGIAAGAGRVVVVGRTDRYGPPTPEDRADGAAWSSTDGRTFVRSTDLNRPGVQSMAFVRFDGRNFVAVGLDDDRLATWSSPDGLAWSPPRRIDSTRGIVPQSASASDGLLAVAGTAGGRPTVWRVGKTVNRQRLPWAPPGNDVRAAVAVTPQRVVALVTDGRSTRAWRLNR